MTVVQFQQVMILTGCFFFNRRVRKQIDICCSKPVSQCVSALRELGRRGRKDNRKRKPS